ncbi:hypothetical protein KR093_001299 [Drosophila rubida]|uniref:Uncharacterized protein n=1 Tax=Drosophila rubida TaxID=30044 RepID=A0AAD4K9S0_9MUSC|nr:hypothetical protein KR093_001299 [Drosophila rubida]
MLCPGHRVLLLAQLLMLALPLLQALPVSSPEIASKSAKSPNSVLAQQQQQQQLKSPSPGGQEPQLNSLSAFASSYESQAQVQPTVAELGFKPSYKLPEMETNFTPMQNGASLLADSPSLASMPSTPMLMQYLPAQTLQDGSGTVQYLQLIPTRPIIVPISPFLSAAAAANGNVQPPLPSPSPSLAANADYGARALPASTGVTGLHYAAAGLQGYANAIAPVAGYRSSYRINREAKEKHLPPTFSLNMNEYLPSGAGVGVGAHEMVSAAAGGGTSHPHTQLYLRARP